LVLFCLVSGSVLAAETDFEHGNEAYAEGKFNEAIAFYLNVLEKDPNLVEVNFNLANAYLQFNELGLSILYFEKVLKLEPNNEKARHNLQLAYLESEHNIEPLPQVFFERWWQQLITYQSVNAWAIYSVAFAWIAVVLFVLRRYKNTAVIKFTAGLSVLICLSCAFLAGRHNKLKTTQTHAIVMEEELQLKKSPDLTAETISTMYEGYKVKMIDSVDAWIQIRLDDESEAWVESSGLRKI
jgi:tetratricopeptide (TPR) repeat protein